MYAGILLRRVRDASQRAGSSVCIEHWWHYRGEFQGTTRGCQARHADGIRVSELCLRSVSLDAFPPNTHGPANFYCWAALWKWCKQLGPHAGGGWAWANFVAEADP